MQEQMTTLTMQQLQMTCLCLFALWELVWTWHIKTEQGMDRRLNEYIGKIPELK